MLVVVQRRTLRGKTQSIPNKDGNFLSESRDRAGGKGHARCYRRHGASLMPSQLNIGVPGASSLYGAPSIAEQVSAETEQLPDFATHRPRMLWRML
jgi:hypothetical protein